MLGMPAVDLAALVARQGVRTTLLASGGPSASVYPQVAAALSAEGIGVAGVLANNHFVGSAHSAKFIRGLHHAAEHAPEVHLDVEPHVLPDFRARRTHYVTRLAGLLAGARAELPDKKITAAVPHWYTAQEIALLLTSCDALHLMTYELTGRISRSRKLRSLLESYGSRVTLALRATDFNSRGELIAWGDKLSGGDAAISVHEILSLSRLPD